MSYERFIKIIAVAFAMLWIALAIQPRSRLDWALENVLLALAMPIFFAAYRHRLFSRLSFGLIFIFMCIHEIGAHHSYSHVPYDEWWRSLTGRSFNELWSWERNHFDRLVHYLYGLLLAYPIREIFLRIANVRGFWGYFLPLDLTMSSSLLYELIEWLAVELLGDESGMAWLGAQGDVWDAHKDMALASLGAIIAMLITAFVNYRCKKDFAREWSDSWRIKAETGDFET